MTSQLQVLNKILQTRNFSIVTLNNLTEDQFFNYTAEFNYIKTHVETYNSVPDKLTFLAAFPDFDLQEVSEPDNYLVEQIFKDFNDSYLQRTFNTIKTLLESDKSGEAANYFVKAAEGFHTTNAMTCTNLFEDTSRFDRYLDRATNKKDYYISTGFKELDDIIGGIDCENENMVIAARTGVGKCLAKGTKVLMADGNIKQVENIAVGDFVQSYNMVNQVVGLHNGISTGWKIIPVNGEPFIVSSNHILTVYNRNEVYDKVKKRMTTNGTGELIDITVEDYLKLSAHARRNMRLIKPSIEYSKKEQLIDPYILGVWLGDGTAKYSQICTMYTEIVEAMTNYAKVTGQKVNMLKDSKNGKAKLYSIVKDTSNTCLQTLLAAENLINNKHIPLNYLTGDRAQRLELLAGLLDTDGCYIHTKTNNKCTSLFDFTNKNKDLFDSVAQLARGLGFKVSIGKPKYIADTYYYRLVISGLLHLIPTKIKRKRAIISESIMNPTLTGFRVEPVEKVEYYGFMCNGDHRYLLADNTLTHNTWMLLNMAAAAAKQGKTVGIYSGEMSVDKVGTRIDTILGHISNTSINRGDLFVQKDYEKYIKGLKTANLGALKVITPNDIAGPATVDALKTFIEKEHLDILFVDQYSLLEDTSHAKQAYEKVANISRAIKNLQVMKQIPIISVSQMNRTKNEDDSQDTTQIAQADRIGQDATSIIMLSKKDDKLILNIVKARDGGDGRKLTYAANFNTGVFTFIPDEHSSAGSAEDLENSYEISDDTEGNPF